MSKHTIRRPPAAEMPIADKQPDELHATLAHFVKRVERSEHRYQANHALCELCPMLKQAHELLDLTNPFSGSPLTAEEHDHMVDLEGKESLTDQEDVALGILEQRADYYIPALRSGTEQVTKAEEESHGDAD